MQRMRVAGHRGERGKMLLAQNVRRGFEDFAKRKIVEVTLRHDADPLRKTADFILSFRHHRTPFSFLLVTASSLSLLAMTILAGFSGNSLA
jgi:hypothetical protein